MTEASQSPFANYSEAQIADEWGAAKARLDKAEDRLEALKKEFLLRGLTLAKGEKFAVLKASSSSDRLDTGKIRTEMGEAWCKKHSKPSLRTTFTVSPLEAAAKA